MAKVARKQLENQLGHSVISPINAQQILAEKKAAQLKQENDD